MAGSRLHLPLAGSRGMLIGMATPLAKLVKLLTPKRRWAQFSLATMFVLVAVAAMPCGWLAWKTDQKQRERVTVAQIENKHGRVVYDWRFEGRRGAQPRG